MPPDTNAVLSTSASIVTLLGGVAAVVAGLSAWLGRVWANRINHREQAALSAELESQRARLSQLAGMLGLTGCFVSGFAQTSTLTTDVSDMGVFALERHDEGVGKGYL